MEHHIIYKYPVILEERFELDIPEGAEILSVQMQRGKPKLWALVDPDINKVKREFLIIGTGNPIYYPLKNLRYISNNNFLKI